MGGRQGSKAHRNDSETEVEVASYVGPATFAGLTFVEDASRLAQLQPDVAVIGAPWDGSCWHRPGARFGPREIRSNAIRPGFYHLELSLPILDHLSAVDFGDASCRHGMVEASHAAIEEKVATVVALGIVPIVLGGDHSITGPTVRAATRSCNGQIGIVHFDAHADTADAVEGNFLSHGTPIRRLIEAGVVSGENVLQLGLRGYWPDQETLAWMSEVGMIWRLAADLRAASLMRILTEDLNRLLDKCSAVYLSVDIDVLDPAFAPGTGTPEPGGLTTAELMEAVRHVARSAPLVGMDLVEVSPPFDHAAITVNAAQRIVVEAMAGLAARRRDRVE